jgi:hypothetical protein
MAAPRKCDHELRRAGRCVLCLRAYQRRRWRAAHPAPRRSSRKRARQVRRYMDALSDWYIRKLLSQGTDIRPTEWRQSTVELKRALLQLKRTLIRLK